MNILFDETTPRPLKKYLSAHTVKTTQEMGWAQVENGELLDRAEAAGFQVLLTTDRNIPYGIIVEDNICRMVNTWSRKTRK